MKVKLVIQKVKLSFRHQGRKCNTSFHIKKKKYFTQFQNSKGLICPPLQAFERTNALNYLQMFRFWYSNYWPFSKVWETPQLMHEGLFSMINGLPESLFKAHRCGSGGTLFTRHWENFERMFTVSVWYCAVIKELKQASMPKELINKCLHD